MESYQVSLFFSQVTRSPRTQTELDDVAEKIARLLEVPVVILLPAASDGLTGLKVSMELNLNLSGRDGFVQFIKSYVKQLDLDFFRARRIQLSGNDMSWGSIQHLTSIRYGEWNGAVKKDFGILVLGTPKPIGNREDLALLIVAQRLAELARVSQLDFEVQLRNQFLSIASHELKTPLTSIYGILQLQERMLRIKEGQVPFPDQERYLGFLKMVIRQVKRLNELIDGLLDVSRIQNGRFQMEPVETDVAALLKECIQSRLNLISEEAGISIQVDAVPKLMAWVDPVRIEEVVTNLVMNAIRYSPEGGVIWVRLTEDRDGFRLSIRDQGQNISDEDRERIFQPFERAQKTSRMGGLGLGLFISRQIAQLHGGSVSLVESVPGKGNIFEAYFPLRNPSLKEA